ncbi:MAG: hypothetical protein Q8K58_03365 [Acidimicrobiales bacterium]|nr:hypothetical protein [Acidimicrobiales bacterium]
MIIVISGPGGVGKGTLVAQLVARDPRLWLSRSWTTRAPRPGESPDAYTFVTREEFERRIAADGFVEWVEFLDYLQGTPTIDEDPDHDVVLEIDVEGARQVKALHPGARLLFIDAPTRAEQQRRLEARGDAPERVRQRLAIADDEAQRSQELEMQHVVNDDLAEALAEVEGLIARWRAEEARER